jgi:hypothetical protein
MSAFEGEEQTSQLRATASVFDPQQTDVNDPRQMFPCGTNVTCAGIRKCTIWVSRLVSLQVWMAEAGLAAKLSAACADKGLAL